MKTRWQESTRTCSSASGTGWSGMSQRLDLRDNGDRQRGDKGRCLPFGRQRKWRRVVDERRRETTVICGRIVCSSLHFHIPGTLLAQPARWRACALTALTTARQCMSWSQSLSSTSSITSLSSTLTRFLASPFVDGVRHRLRCYKDHVSAHSSR